MRSVLLAAMAAVALVGAAQAATPPAPQPIPTPPRVFTMAGYTEPVIPASSCKVVSATETQCLIPAMTAGRYLADATGVSTATADGAGREIAIVAGDHHCTLTYTADPKKPWAVGQKHAFHVGCVFSIVTDTAMTITVVYADGKATKDPAGPQLTVTPQPWAGVLNAVAVTFQQ
jgi:hypothetical protein